MAHICVIGLKPMRKHILHRKRYTGKQTTAEAIHKRTRGFLIWKVSFTRETIRKFMQIDQPSKYDGPFLSHTKCYLHLTWSTCSSSIDAYIHNLHVCTKGTFILFREYLIVNPSQFFCRHCFLTNACAKWWGEPQLGRTRPHKYYVHHNKVF